MGLERLGKGECLGQDVMMVSRSRERGDSTLGAPPMPICGLKLEKSGV